MIIYFLQMWGINFTFNLDNCSEIIALYEDDTFATADEMEELYDKKMLNVSLDSMQYLLVLEESANTILAQDDFEVEALYGYTAKKVYYELFS